MEKRLVRAIESGDKMRLIEALQQAGTVTSKVLQHACKLGLADTVTLLIAYCIELDQEGPEGSALYIACELGYADVAETLLCNGATLQPPQPSCLKDVFFETAYRGWLPVLLVLLQYREEVLYKECELNVILEGACYGDHVHILKYCLDAARKAGMQELENSFPNLLHVACQAGSSQIVQYLLKTGAKLTETLVSQYPDTIQEALALGVKALPVPVGGSKGHEQQVIINWSSYNICSVSPEWFQPYVTTLTELDLSYNNLQTVPAAIPWTLTGLSILNLSKNKLEKMSEPERGIQCNGLKEVYLSDNMLKAVPNELFKLESLEKLNLARNSLKALSATIIPAAETMPRRSRYRQAVSLDQMLWSCSKLTHLYVQNNQLTSLPEQICFCCAQLQYLNASDNLLETFLPAWSCPLEVLKLCNNQLQTLSCSLDDYWGKTLHRLELDDNKITEISQSICRLASLRYLYLAGNQISQLPLVHWWESHLEEIDLSRNVLCLRPEAVPTNTISFFSRGGTTKRASEEDLKGMEFPLCFADSLTTLDLSRNKLEVVPPSLCELVSLQRLNLSLNRRIHELPLELCNLEQCHDLGLEGLKLKNIPSSLVSGSVSAGSVLMCLKQRKRKSVPYNKLKLMVVGKESKGKTSLIASLLGKPPPPNLATNGIVIHQFTIQGSSVKIPAKKRSSCTQPLPDMLFQVWDFAGQSDFYVTHKVFLSPTALFLLVFDLRMHKKGLESLKPWLLDIQAHAVNSMVVIVGTFLDQLTGDRTELRQELLRSLQTLYPKSNGYPDIRDVCLVSCISGEGIEQLKSSVYSVVMDMKVKGSVWSKYQAVKVIERKVPKSYVELEKLVISCAATRQKCNLPPVLNHEEFIDLMSSIKDNDISDIEDITSVTKFLHEVGTLLHFDDQLRGLSGLYFIDPSWLAETLARFITLDAVHKSVQEGCLSIAQIQQLILKGVARESVQVFQYIQLLEKFEIALMLDPKRLLLPCRLPAVRPGLSVFHESQDFAEPHWLFRFFKMPYVPSGFWSRLITRILAMDKVLREQDSNKEDRKEVNSMRHIYHSYKVKDPAVVYWQHGLYYNYLSGFYCIESAQHYTDSKASEKVDGILVTFHSTSGSFSAAGFVLDQVESIIEQWYPGLDDSAIRGTPSRLDRLLLCPECVSRSGLTSCLNRSTMLSVQECAMALLSGDSITCPKCQTSLPLNTLIPELVLTDLHNPELFIDKERLALEERLGHGGEASVFLGKLDGKTPVAIKQSHVTTQMAVVGCSLEACSNTSSENPDVAVSGSTESGDSGAMSQCEEAIESLSCEDGESDATPTSSRKSCKDSNSSGTGSGKCSVASSASGRTSGSFGRLSDVDCVMTNMIQAKLLQCLRTLRQEVSLLSRLKHPCIVSLLGVNMSMVSMVLELCPLGSLRTVLDRHLKEGKEQHVAVLDRKTTYQVLLQVSSAVCYLHSMDIIYKDLKCDNVLVSSMDPPQGVHVKISDYGLSAYSTQQGAMGNQGTPGYQAPEMTSGSPYSQKVDVFAFAMVIYEVLSGQSPFLRQPCVSIQKAISLGRRPSLQECGVDPDMPALIQLMKSCWLNNQLDRPSSAQVVHLMRDASFLCHVRTLPVAPAQTKLQKVSCACSFEMASDGRLPLLKLWTGKHDYRKYHVASPTEGVFKVRDEESEGPQVMCMTVVDGYTIVGTVVGTTGCELNILESHKALGRLVPATDPVQCEAIPLALLLLCQDDKKLVVTGLSSGQLMIFKWQAPHLVQERVINLTKEDGTGDTVCLANVTHQGELWAGSGDEVVVLQKGSFDITNRIQVFGSQGTGKILTGLVCEGHQAWCIAYKHSQVVELDVETKQVICFFDCSATSLNNEVIVNFDPLKDCLEGAAIDIAKEELQQEKDLKEKKASVHVLRRRRKEKARSSSLKRKLPLNHQLSQNESRPTGQGLCSQPNKATAILHVGGTLWVGRTCGDVLVINTSADNPYGYKFGQVMATLCTEYKEKSHLGDGRVAKLERLGKDTVVAVRTLWNEEPKPPPEEIEIAELVVWEAWGLDEVHQLNTMWEGLMPRS